MAVVTKRDLAMAISEKTEQSQSMVLKVIDQLITEATDSLADGDEVTLRNFGTFRTRINRPKVGRNPKVPDKEIIIPARRVVSFRVGKELKGRVAE